MLISETHRFVFIHVPKTAGDSVWSVLNALCDDKWRNKDQIIDPKNGISLKHIPAREIRARFFGDGRWGTFLRFGFIRNPWDAVHSDYHFCRNHEPPGKQYGEWHDKVVLAHKVDFNEFVRQTIGEGLGNYDYYFTNHSGHSLVSFIGRFEKLEDDWKRLMREIGLDFRKFKLPKVNVTKDKPDYRSEYTKKTRRLVQRRYYRDIEIFGYTF